MTENDRLSSSNRCIYVNWAKDRDLFNQLCPKYVKFSAELIEKVL